jgi:hypothetical protein
MVLGSYKNFGVRSSAFVRVESFEEEPDHLAERVPKLFANPQPPAVIGDFLGNS